MKVLYGAGWLAHFLHDAARARALLDESLAIARALEDAWAEAWITHVLGRVAYFEGVHARARGLAQQSLAIAERLDDRRLMAWAVHLLGLAAHLAGEYAQADALYARSMAIWHELGHRESIAVLSQMMGLSAHRQGDVPRARALYQEHLATARELGSTFHVGNVLGQLGSLAAAQGQPARAARLLGAAAGFHEASLTRSIPLIEALVAEAAGRRMSSEEAIAEALAVEVRRPRQPAPDGEPARPAGPLTEREQEVAALIARGLTNRQIAAHLIVSERTAEAHVRHILDKLGCASRTQIGVWVARAD
jgi:non-specific serine/threonine protein kinase